MCSSLIALQPSLVINDIILSSQAPLPLLVQQHSIRGWESLSRERVIAARRAPGAELCTPGVCLAHLGPFRVQFGTKLLLQLIGIMMFMHMQTLCSEQLRAHAAGAFPSQEPSPVTSHTSTPQFLMF